MISIEAYNSVIRQYVWEAVTILLDDYFLYGFLYDNQGRIKPEYINAGCEIREDGSDGPLVDAEGDEIVVEKYLAENMYEIPNKYYSLNPYLDVHSNVHFSEQDWVDIKYMNNAKIKKRYIGDSMEQLVAMLRRGHNYAMTLPVATALTDEYLEDTICFVWRMFVLDTMNVHDVKNKYFVPGHEYYKKGEETKYNWDSRPYYDRITDVEDITVHKNGNVTVNYNTNQNNNRTSDMLIAERRKKEAQILRIIDISLSKSDKEKSIAYQVDQASINFSDINYAETSVNNNSPAKRMAHIFNIY